MLIDFLFGCIVVTIDRLPKYIQQKESQKRQHEREILLIENQKTERENIRKRKLEAIEKRKLEKQYELKLKQNGYKVLTVLLHEIKYGKFMNNISANKIDNNSLGFTIESLVYHIEKQISFKFDENGNMRISNWDGKVFNLYLFNIYLIKGFNHYKEIFYMKKDNKTHLLYIENIDHSSNFVNTLKIYSKNPYQFIEIELDYILANDLFSKLCEYIYNFQNN